MIYALTPLSVVAYGILIYWLIGEHKKENLLLSLVCVVMGIGSAAVALGLEYLWHLLTNSFMNSHPAWIVLESFIGVSMIEEAAKWIWLVLIIRRWSSFNLYTDGILFSCGIVAGFNLVEGVLYAITENDIANAIIRCFTAVPVHFLFAIVMGFLFSRFRLESKSFLWHSLWIPILLHGLYDFFILQTFTDVLMAGALVVLLGCLLLSVWICRIAIRADQSMETNRQDQQV